MRYVFGPFVLDGARHELTRDGELLAIEPQVFELLLYLVEHREQVASKDDLIEAIWNGRFVSDSAVSTRVKSARKALGDDGKTQQYIRTVHGRGFRFVADVLEGEASEPISEAQKPAAAIKLPPRKIVSVRAAILAAGALSVIFICIAVYLATRLPTPVQNRLAVLPVINATGDEGLEWIELGLMSLAVDDIERGSANRLVSVGAVMRAVETDPVSETGDLEISDELRSRLERVYGASHIVLSRLGKQGDEFRLEYRVVSPRGISAPRALFGDAPARLALDMSRSVLAALPRSGEAAMDMETISSDPFVMEAYARGRALQYQGRVAESLNMFEVAADEEPENFWVRYEQALSLRMLGEYEASKARLDDLLVRANEMNDPEALQSVLNGLGRIHAARNEREKAISRYLEALEAGRSLNDPARSAFILTNLGIEERRNGNFDASELYLSRAITEYDAAQMPIPPGELLNSLALLKYETGDIEAAEDYLHQALEAFRLSGAELSQASVLKNLGELSIALGRWNEADQRMLESLEIRTRLDNTAGQLSSLSGLAELRLRQGRFDEAIQYAERLLETAQLAGSLSGQVTAHDLLGEILGRRGETTAAFGHLTAAIGIEEDRERERNVLELKVKLLRFAPSADLNSEALQTDLAELSQEAAAYESNSLTVLISETQAELALRAEEVEAASAYFGDAWKASRLADSPSDTARLSARLGQAELTLGDSDAAAAYLGMAREVHPDHFEVLILSARLAEQRGETEQASELMAAAELAAGDHWPRAISFSPVLSD